MHTGMLWFDNSQASLNVKVQKAAEYYEKKHGRKPTLVLVHPSMLPGKGGAVPLKIDGINLRAYRPVLPGHIWVGIADKE